MAEAIVFPDFETAAQGVLEYLQSRVGFDLWMLTHVAEDDWLVLFARDHGYNIEPGTIFRWSESFCHQMVQGKAPCVAPEADIVLPYAQAGIGKRIRIGAYMGAPVRYRDGTLFGTLCAIHPTPQPASIVKEEGLLQLLAALLGCILQSETDAAGSAAATRPWRRSP